jgi:putative membrane protein
MQMAASLFDEQQRNRIEQSVVEAESSTSCEIVPVVATCSGRYDRPEDIIGLWMAVLAAIAVWIMLPRTGELGSWGETPLYAELLTLAAAVVVAFIVGAVAGSRLSWLRQLFTPRKQMVEEVAARAREVFFDNRVHHTSGATGLLIYVSLYERTAMILGDQEILGNPSLGQAFIDRCCQQLTEGLHQGHPSDAICAVIEQAGQQLAESLPRQDDDVNELHDALVLID